MHTCVRYPLHRVCNGIKRRESHTLYHACCQRKGYENHQLRILKQQLLFWWIIKNWCTEIIPRTLRQTFEPIFCQIFGFYVQWGELPSVATRHTAIIAIQLCLSIILLFISDYFDLWLEIKSVEFNHRVQF